MLLLSLRKTRWAVALSLWLPACATAPRQALPAVDLSAARLALASAEVPPAAAPPAAAGPAR